METMIRIDNVTKTFVGKDNQVEALKGINLEIHKGEIYGIIGMSGAGKSTMMRAIGQAMEKKGEQVEYLYCSGDPSSLDGVHIPRIRTAVVDGTAPHGRGTKGQFCGTSMIKMKA